MYIFNDKGLKICMNIPKKRHSRGNSWIFLESLMKLFFNNHKQTDKYVITTVNIIYPLKLYHKIWDIIMDIPVFSSRIWPIGWVWNRTFSRLCSLLHCYTHAMTLHNFINDMKYTSDICTYIHSTTQYLNELL